MKKYNTLVDYNYQHMSETKQDTQNDLKLPSNKTYDGAFRLSIKTGKKVCGYFYLDSLSGNVSICHDGEDKLIYKNSDEYTSPLVNLYKSGDEYIAVTENTIYIVSSKCEIRKQ